MSEMVFVDGFDLKKFVLKNIDYSPNKSLSVLFNVFDAVNNSFLEQFNLIVKKSDWGFVVGSNNKVNILNCFILLARAKGFNEDVISKTLSLDSSKTKEDKVGNKIGSFNTGFLSIEVMGDRNVKNGLIYELIYFKGNNFRVSEFKTLGELNVWAKEVEKLVKEVSKLK
jgi:hypothetical protein